MAFPVVESIAQDLEKAIQKVSVAAGYQNNLIVERAKQFGPSRIQDRLCVIHQGDPGEQKDSPVDFVTWDATFICACYCVESESSDVPIDQRINTIACDVEKAAMQDRQRSGLAHDTFVIGSERYSDPTGNAYEGVMVEIRVRYRTPEDDPYTRA